MRIITDNCILCVDTSNSNANYAFWIQEESNEVSGSIIMENMYTLNCQIEGMFHEIISSDSLKEVQSVFIAIYNAIQRNLHEYRI